MSARDSEVPRVVAPEPSLKYAATSDAAAFIAASSAITAERMPPKTMTCRPLAFSSWAASPSTPVLSPTLRTSAAATPSGYGRSEPVTRARRSGMEYITPSTPPMAHTAAVSTKEKPCQ